MSKKYPRYPIYIISKGRWEHRYTANALDNMGVPYRLAVEEHEYDNYCEAIGDEKKVIKLPFSNHGLGSGPARNYCWEHSISEGYDRHWLLDDNIGEFWRIHRNKRYRVDKGGAIFRAAEDFVDRYENIAFSGFQYKWFTTDDAPYTPYVLNVRVMSCFLIQNNVDLRWRGKYNEDVDICLRALKEGYCTLLFYAFLNGKKRTGTVKGGNTEELYGNYKDDSAYKKSRMLVEMHPDCVKLVERYGRVHHEVDMNAIINKYGYPARQNPLILKKDVPLLNTVDNYDMKLARNYQTPDQYYDLEFTESEFPTGRKGIHR